MSEISQVQLTLPEPNALPAPLRARGGGAPAWLAVDEGRVARIAWWGARGLRAEPPRGVEPARAGLFPRSVEGRDSGPRGLILATLDADRATFDLAPILGGTWTDAGDEPVLGGRCRVAELGEARLVLAEPTTEGYLAACLARFGEGPVALAIDGRTDAGREVASNPLNGGPARWIRLGQGTAPYLLVVLAR